jgi:LysR family transcriptional activator of dmlA
MKQESHPRLERADLELLLAIRQHGSLAATAEALGVVPSVVTKRLAGMEQRLRLKLFHRTTRRVSPTAEGEVLCQRAAHLLAEFHAVESEVRERHAEPSGDIRLAATFGFGRRWLGPALADFQAAYPQLNLQLTLTERLPDLAAEGFDGAVWLWSVRGQRASDWTGRRLARNQRVVVASPSYLAQHGTPRKPEDLAAHACLIVREHDQRFDTWVLNRERDRTEVRVRVAGALSSNSGELVRDWCLAGRGLMLRSLWDAAPLLASGELMRVLPGYAMTDADVHWLAPHLPQVPKRIRLLVDHLADRFRQEPWLRPAKASAPPDSRRPR